MKFVLLVRVAPDADPAPDQTDPSGWLEYGTNLGMWLEGHRLEETTDATTVTVREGRTLVTDGPFAEFKEHIAGYDLIEASSVDDAVDLASRHPAATFGAIEVRQVWTEFMDDEDAKRERGSTESPTGTSAVPH